MKDKVSLPLLALELGLMAPVLEVTPSLGPQRQRLFSMLSSECLLARDMVSGDTLELILWLLG